MEWHARWTGSGARMAGLWLAGLVLATGAAVVALPFTVSVFARATELLLEECVSMAMSISTGASVWTVARTVARSLASAFVTPQASGVLATLGLVAVGAFWGLQRLLGSE